MAADLKDGMEQTTLEGEKITVEMLPLEGGGEDDYQSAIKGGDFLGKLRWTDTRKSLNPIILVC